MQDILLERKRLKRNRDKSDNRFKTYSYWNRDDSMVEEKKQIDEDKIVENSSEDENIGDSKKDNSEKSEVDRKSVV